MHELTITQNILSIALEKAQAVQASKINKINLTIGELTGIVADCVQFYFEQLSKDTIAAKATLSFEQPPAKLYCRNCGIIFSPNNLDWACPACHEQNIEIIAGRECYVNSIEVD
jgi:hydrogenase nickel incorporation protein HypA/HybF